MTAHPFDVNVLLVMFDTGHEHHQGARFWWAVRSEEEWCTCPIGENARVTSAKTTDTFLLALAITHGGKLATFDRKIPGHLLPGGAVAHKVIPVQDDSRVCANGRRIIVMTIP
jgi:predicted nucleic acid-binding protein